MKLVNGSFYYCSYWNWSQNSSSLSDRKEIGFLLGLASEHNSGCDAVCCASVATVGNSKLLCIPWALYTQIKMEFTSRF